MIEKTTVELKQSEAYTKQEYSIKILEYREKGRTAINK